MSYLVLARKYRPRDFAALAGQPHVVQALANALTQQRLHHAYLFTGTRGVGKTTVSRILAKSLNCTGADGQGGITATPCGVCDACRDIDAGRFIDYVELDAASNRSVDEITQLLDQAVYKPVLGRFKVYMIDEVHMLSNHAFNAMLKTLEEPPEYLKFVLATTDPQKVPPTVLSRCLQFNLRPLAPQTMREHLAQVLDQEGIGAEPAALQLIARAARGSMRDALSLTDQAIAFGGGSLAEAGVRQMLGAVDRGHAVRLVEALAARDGAAVIAAVDQLRALGLSASGTLEEMALLLQQMAVQQAVPEAVDVGEPDAAELPRLAGLLAPDETQLLYSIVLHGREEIALAPDEYSGLVMVLLRLLSFPPQGDRPAPRSTAALSVARPATATVAAPPPVRELRQVAPAAKQPGRAPAERTGAAGLNGSEAAGRPDQAAQPKAATVDRPPAASDAPPSWVEDEIPPEAEAVSARPARAEPGAGPAPKPGAASPGSAGVHAGQAATPASHRPAQATPRPEPLAAMDRPAAAESAERETGLDAAGAAAGAAPHAGAAALTMASAACGDRWADVVQQLCAAGRITALARELALQAQCVAIDAEGSPQVWRLRVEREMLRAASHCEKLQTALGELLGCEVRVHTEAGRPEDSPARREAAERARRQAEAEHTIENDPLVRALLGQYKTARIVPGSVKSL